MGLPLTSHVTPIVFVVDDDISVRESLEWLIRCEGWQSETFASAHLIASDVPNPRSEKRERNPP